jgi:hypothetical protein
MAEFIQVVEYTTTRIDEMLALGEKMAQSRAAAGAPGPMMVVVAADRDTPNRYQTIVRFSSYEEAMASSEHPETSEFAQQMAALCDGPPVFRNLDVVLTWRA